MTPVPGHDVHQGQEDLYRSTTRMLGTLISENGRTLGQAADATASLGVSQTVQASVGAANLALGIIDGLQAHKAFQSGDRVMGTLNTVGCAANLIGGSMALANWTNPSSQLSTIGNVAQSVGILADATEDFVESRRLDRPAFIVRGSAKAAGAGLLLAGTLVGDPTLQLVGNLVCLGGLALHYLPAIR